MRLSRLGLAGVVVLGAGGLTGTALGGGEVVGYDPQTITVSEADGEAVMTIARNACQIGRFDVLAHAPNPIDPGDATEGEDYEESHLFDTWDKCDGTGRATTTFTVPIVDDGDEEGDERIELILDSDRTHTNDAHPVPAAVPGGTIVIEDDDGPRFDVSAGVTANEQDGRARIAFRLVNGPGEPTSIGYLTRSLSARGGEDFEHTDDSVGVEADGRGTVEIPVMNDGKAEGDEQFEVDLEWGEDAGTTVTVTLKDPPEVQKELPPAPVTTTATTATTATTPPPPPPASAPRSTPSKAKCVSKRRFTLQLKGLKSAKVRVGSKQMKVHRSRTGKLSATVDLRGNPKGRYTVKIAGTNADGKSVAKIRRYRTCTPGRG